MAGCELAEKALRTLFDDSWSGSEPVEYENVGTFKPPATGAWLRWTCRPEGGKQASMSPPVIERVFGRVVVQVFVPLGTGVAELLRLADAVGAIYDGVKVAGTTIQCQRPVITMVPRQPTERWQQANVNVPFYLHVTAAE